MKIHPRRNDRNQPVRLDHPSVATPLSSWHAPGDIATVVPDGTLPDSINGMPVRAWADVPGDAAGWAQLGRGPASEPEFKVPAGVNASAGVVALEPCGRVWVVSPSNRYGGYTNPGSQLNSYQLVSWRLRTTGALRP